MTYLPQILAYFHKNTIHNERPIQHEHDRSCNDGNGIGRRFRICGKILIVYRSADRIALNYADYLLFRRIVVCNNANVKKTIPNPIVFVLALTTCYEFLRKPIISIASLSNFAHHEVSRRGS